MLTAEFTKLRNGLYMDNKTKKIGKLVKSPKGGWYVDDEWYENERPERIKAKRTEINSKLYENPEEAKYVSKIVDYNAKNRVERYANYNTEDVVAKSKDIENDIRSLYIYKNEKNMGAGEPEPLKKYYDKYGKKDVDSVWKDMDRKYAVIEGTSMDSEGLRYNSLVEKRKYSSEAIENYRKKAEQAWKNYYGDSRKYNEEVGKAREEFENSNKLNKGEAYQNKNGAVVEIKDKDENGWTTYSMQTNPTTPPSYKTFQEENVKNMLKDNGYEKVREGTHLDASESQLRRLATDYKDVADLRDEYEDKILSSYNDTSPMSEYSDTTGTGYTDRQMKAYKDYLLKTQGTTDENIINAGREPENRVSIEKFEAEQAKIERFSQRKGKTQETYTPSGNIRYSAFGIERTPEDDFSDDGTRFTAYRLPNGMEMTVAKDSDDIYLSVNKPYNKEVSYEEYSSLPHYKDLDMYNGVRKDSVDLSKVIDASNKYLNEYNELLKKKGIKPETRTNKELRLDSIKRQIENNEASIKHYNESKDYSLWRYNRQQMNRLMKKNEKLRKELEKLS